MALPPVGPFYSFSRPDLARVTHIRFDLNVDFDRNVLKGSATLTIERVSSINEIVLDSYGLVISSVRSLLNEPTESCLKYQLEDFGIYGSKFTIQLPQIKRNSPNENFCEIEIEYETSPNSPALYWLKREQTAGGKRPFLLSHNKYDSFPTFVRAVFPCQDTPFVKFTYFATISTPLDFTALMSASLVNSYTITDKRIYIYFFCQDKPVPSYAVIIAVGVLQQKNLPNSRTSVWFDKYCHPYTDVDLTSFLQKTETLLKDVKSRFGAKYPWEMTFLDFWDICLLPISVSDFKIECPCLTFVSPFSISEYISGPINYTIAENGAVVLAEV